MVNYTISAEGLRLIAEGLNRLADAFAEQGQDVRPAMTTVAPQTTPQMAQPVPVQTAAYPGAVQAQSPVATSQPLPTQPVAPVPMPPVVPTTAVAQEYTQDQLAVACAGLVNQGKQPRLMQILQGLGVATLVDLPKERYGELATALRAEGAVI